MQNNLLGKVIILTIIIFIMEVIVISSTGTVVEKQFLKSYNNYGFGYRLYEPGSQYDPGPVTFKLNDPETVYALAYYNNTITGGCYNPNTYTWYVCDDMGNIWTVDIWSGAMTIIGGNSENLSALAYDSQTNTMYGAYQDFLYGIDMQTGDKLWEWSTGIFDISGMAANGFGYLYIVDKITDDLWRLDIETFTSTCVGPLFIDLEDIADLEFDFDTEILYLSAYTTQGELYKINTWIGEATLIDNFEEGARISGFIIPWNWPSCPPEAPKINGPQTGKSRHVYTYKFVSEDPDADDVYYHILWGDDDFEEWIGPYKSDEVVFVNHSWPKKGTYTIMARAKDVYGAIGEWGTLEVTMPKNKPHIFNFPLLSWLFERFPNVFPVLRYLLGL